MYHLLRNQIVTKSVALVCVLSLGLLNPLKAQLVELNLPDHDNKFYYLGIGLIYNNSRFYLSHHPQFLTNDTILSINPLNTGGFGLAGMHTLRLTPRLEVRAVFPQLLFSYKNLTYNIKYPNAFNEESAVMTKKVESILLGFPVHLKFKSDRIDNFRVYIFGGAKLEYDLASNSSARKADDLVKLRKMDYGVEAGIGFNFYFPVFILSPEIKISNGLFNTHSRDINLKFSNTIDQLRSRMVLFSLIFEG